MLIFMPNNSKTKKVSDYLKYYYYDIPYEGSTSAGKPLRKLKDITCPYRGVKIITSDSFRWFENSLKKCKTAVEYVELLSRYVDYMLPTEKSIYAIFKDFASINPDDSIQNCLQMIKDNCLMKLKLEEFAVLDDVDMLSRKLSPSTALKLRAKTTRCRQVILNDSKKDTFKRKSFLSSLEEIQPKENEKEIFMTIKNKAIFLPTSESSKNAFVVKYCKRRQNEIARRIFVASTASIEHITPASNGGLNTIGNFLLTTANGNRYRENMPLHFYIQRFPEIPMYTQQYMDDIIQQIHNGKLLGNETYPYKVKKKLYEASDGRILISLSKYKYSEEEAAEAVKEYEHRFDKYKNKTN